MAKKSFLAQQREKLGLTQEELADYLRVKRSLLARVEVNGRQLQTTPYLDLIQLYSNYSESLGESEPHDFLNLDQKDTLKLIDSLRKEREWDLLLLEKKNAQMGQENKSNVNRFLTFLKIQETLEAQFNSENKSKIDWLINQQSKIRERLKKCNKSHIRLLGIRIAVIKLEFSELNKWKEEIIKEDQK